MRQLKFGLIFLLAVIALSCTTDFGSGCEEGIGEDERRIVGLELINSIELGMSADLFVSEGPQKIEIEAPSNIIDKIVKDSDISNGKWTIDIDGCYDGPDVKVWVTLPFFTTLSIAGSGDVTTLDTLRNRM